MNTVVGISARLTALEARSVSAQRAAGQLDVIPERYQVWAVSTCSVSSWLFC